MCCIRTRYCCCCCTGISLGIETEQGKQYTMSGGNPELLEVQEKLELLNTEYDKLNDEWTGRLAAQQDEFQREKYVRLKRGP